MLDDAVSQQVKASQKLSDIENENAKLQQEAEKIAREVSEARAAWSLRRNRWTTHWMP